MGNKPTATDLLDNLNIPSTQRKKFRDEVKELLAIYAGPAEEQADLSQEQIERGVTKILEDDKFVARYWPQYNKSSRPTTGSSYDNNRLSALNKLCEIWCKSKKSPKQKDSDYKPSQSTTQSSTQSSTISSYYPKQKQMNTIQRDKETAKFGDFAAAGSVRVALRTSAAEALANESNNDDYHHRTQSTIAFDIPHDEDDVEEDELPEISEIVSPRKNETLSRDGGAMFQTPESPTTSKGKDRMRRDVIHSPREMPPTSISRATPVQSPTWELNDSTRKRQREIGVAEGYETDESIAGPSKRRNANQRSMTAIEEIERPRSLSTIRVDLSGSHGVPERHNDPISVSTHSNTPLPVGNTISTEVTPSPVMPSSTTKDDSGIAYLEEFCEYLQECKHKTLKQANSVGVSSKQMELLNHDAALINQICSDAESRLQAWYDKQRRPDADCVLTSFTLFR